MRRVYVGLSAPLAYDYANPMREPFEGTGDVPNPVLENVNGLLLCYDELWFPGRAFCPRDMHELPYVRFIEDLPEQMTRAVEAVGQFRHLNPDDWGVRTGSADDYHRSLETVTRAVPFETRLDNHSRGSEFGMGNAGDARLFLTDVGVARALDLQLEIAVNTRLSPAAASLASLGLRTSFDPVHLSVAEDLAVLRTVDHLGPTGAYHESIEELRAHRHVAEFREYLESSEIDEHTTSDVVRAANEQADLYDKQVRDRYFRGRGRLHAVAKAALAPIGNAVLPGLGSLAKGSVTVAEWRERKSFEGRVAWAVFVLDARLNGRRSPALHE